MKNKIELISELCKLPTVSGNEQYGIERLVELVGDYFDEYKTTPTGSFIGIINSQKKNAKKIILDAHFDQVGMMVTNVFSDGFLSVVNVGGIDTNVLQASKVLVYGKKIITGVFASKPPHLQSPGEADAKTEIKNLYIDTGYKEGIEEIVSVGDIVVYDSKVEPLNNEMLVGKAFDDKICIATILETIKKLDKNKLNYDLYCVFSGGEEIGYIGAQTSAFEINPDCVIVLDVCTAEEPDDKRYEHTIYMEKGGVISLSPTISKELTQNLISCAKNNNILYQIEAEVGRTGTNAHAFQIAREGIPTAIISYPLRNMHTPSEIVSLKDMDSISELAAMFLQEEY
ncbi:M20/M25/M40 family metallo-hydrolase [Eubacteriales bacterium OttesenSCG-928-G02]|nr:M20/M25/M40 family metallo-hydrolase [Eubacteriales bacterium OttesenSCG-928-G02]